jgi:phage shock protein E
MKKIYLLSLILTALLLAGCAAANPPAEAEDQGAYDLISAAELDARLNERRESFILVNTHIPFEGNLPTTDFSVPYNEISENLDQFPDDKDAEIILYCMSNRMALIAADELVQAGYSNLRLLDGGMLAWHSAGLTLVMEP